MGVRPRAALIVALLIVAAALIGWLAVSDKEPRYDGRPLTYWVEALASGKEDRAQAEEAIQKIGTNAFPFLLRWIRSPEQKYRKSLRWLAAKLPNGLGPKWAREDYIAPPSRAMIAIKALGHEARSLVPELERLAADPNAEGADAALRALARMGSNGVPALLAAIRNPSHPQRISAVSRLLQTGDLGPYTNVVISELIAQLDDPGLAGEPALALTSLIPPELVTPTLAPALARWLENTNSRWKTRIRTVSVLAHFKEKAANALPALTNALNDPNAEVRRQATNAIQAIHRAAAESR